MCDEMEAVKLGLEEGYRNEGTGFVLLRIAAFDSYPEIRFCTLLALSLRHARLQLWNSIHR